jgi:hypothetical protein
MSTRPPPPKSVRIALAMFWGAWALSGVLIVVNYMLLKDYPTAASATLASFIPLLVQAAVLYFLGRGSNVARIALAILLVLAAPGMYFATKLISNLSLVSAALSVVGYLIRVAAIGIMLFEPDARRWFKPPKAPPAEPAAST